MPKQRPPKLLYGGLLDPDRIIGFRAAPPWLPCDVVRWPGEGWECFLERVRATSSGTRATEVDLELILRPES